MVDAPALGAGTMSVQVRVLSSALNLSAWSHFRVRPFLFLTFILKYKHEKNFNLFFDFVVGVSRCSAGFLEFGVAGGGKCGVSIFHHEVASDD